MLFSSLFHKNMTAEADYIHPVLVVACGLHINDAPVRFGA